MSDTEDQSQAERAFRTIKAMVARQWRETLREHTELAGSGVSAIVLATSVLMTGERIVEAIAKCAPETQGGAVQAALGRDEYTRLRKMVSDTSTALGGPPWSDADTAEMARELAARLVAREKQVEQTQGAAVQAALDRKVLDAIKYSLAKRHTGDVALDVANLCAAVEDRDETIAMLRAELSTHRRDARTRAPSLDRDPELGPMRVAVEAADYAREVAGVEKEAVLSERAISTLGDLLESLVMDDTPRRRMIDKARAIHAQLVTARDRVLGGQ